MTSDNGDESLDALFNDVKDAIGPLASDAEDVSRPTTKGGSADTRGSLGNDKTTFPTEMNCSQVFDQLLKCYSLGGQLRNYYRYGEISYCQDKRAKLKFCLGTKMLSEDDRRLKIKHWYMENLAEQQANKQTSEMVWKSRDAPLRLPFREDSELFLQNENN